MSTKSSRRKFLVGSGLVLGTYLVHRHKQSQKYEEDYPVISKNNVKLEKNGKSVVIVGAGLSGLMTACDLIDRGFTVTIVEKNCFPGGKLLSWEDPAFLTKDKKPFVIEHATHGVWSHYNNFREFISRRNIVLREKTVNEPYSAFSVVHPEGVIKDLKNGTRWPSLLYTLNETDNFDFNNTSFKYSQIIKLLAFDPNDASDVEKLDAITMYDWCTKNNIPKSTIENFVDPLLKMSNFSDSKDASALAWFRHTSNTFGHWKDLARIQFFLNSPQDNLVKPLEKYIKENGGTIIYNTPITDIKIQNNRVTSVDTHSVENKFACQVCGHLHDHDKGQCDKCGHVGPMNKTLGNQQSFKADYFLFGVDIPSLKELVQCSDLKHTQSLKTIESLKPMKVVVLYLAFLKSDCWQNKLGEREVFFSARFNHIGTVLNVNHQKPELLKDSNYDVFEIQVPAKDDFYAKSDEDIIKLIQSDLKLLFSKSLPDITNYRILRWDNFSGERVFTQKNALKHETAFENLFLLGDHIAIDENAQFMEKVAIVSKKVINSIVRIENLQNGDMEIVESETPDMVLSLIRKLASPV